jgi:uncharacterized membrane protein
MLAQNLRGATAMNAAHLHLILNHVPVLGTLIALLLLITAMVEKSEDLRRAALALFVGVAIMAVPVFLSGEPAEELVERIPGVTSQQIDRHEDAATQALIAVAVVGVLAIGALAAARRSPRGSRALTIATLAVGIVTSGLMARAALLGGQVRHSEIQAGAPAAPASEVGEREAGR